MGASYDEMVSNHVVTHHYLSPEMMKESALCNHSDTRDYFVFPPNSPTVSNELPQNKRVVIHYNMNESLLMLEELDEDDASRTDQEADSFSRFKEEEAARYLPYFLQLKRCNVFGQASVGVNHPFVLFLSDFALATYNELCRKHFKKTVHDNIYGGVATQATYFPNRFGYIFSLTIEAMEEDVAGVYEAKVFINSFKRRRTLIKFVRSPCAPIGRKFKGRNDLIDVHEALNDKQKAIRAELCSPRKGKKRSLPKSVRLERFYATVKGRKRSKGSVQFHSLKKKYETKEGARVIAELQAHLLKQKSWEIKRSNSEYWSVPNQASGLQPRSSEHLCGGYDYHNPVKVKCTYRTCGVVCPDYRFNNWSSESADGLPGL